MSDDSSAFFALFFIFFQKFLCARESDLGDIALYFILGHTNTVIRYDQLFFLAVNGDNHLWLVSVFQLCLSNSLKAFQFFNCITAVGNNFS